MALHPSVHGSKASHETQHTIQTVFYLGLPLSQTESQMGSSSSSSTKALPLDLKSVCVPMKPESWDSDDKRTHIRSTTNPSLYESNLIPALHSHWRTNRSVGRHVLVPSKGNTFIANLMRRHTTCSLALNCSFTFIYTVLYFVIALSIFMCYHVIFQGASAGGITLNGNVTRPYLKTKPKSGSKISSNELQLIGLMSTLICNFFSYG